MYYNFNYSFLAKIALFYDAIFTDFYTTFEIIGLPRLINPFTFNDGGLEYTKFPSFRILPHTFNIPHLKCSNFTSFFLPLSNSSLEFNLFIFYSRKDKITFSVYSDHDNFLIHLIIEIIIDLFLLFF